MKMRRAHDVPLSWPALEVLAEAARLQRSDSLIFALRGSSGLARQPSQRTVSDALRQLGRVDAEGRPFTLHGFRTTFRVWQMECVPGSSEAAEIALAHQESDTTNKACARSALDAPRASSASTVALVPVPLRRPVVVRGCGRRVYTPVSADCGSRYPVIR